MKFIDKALLVVFLFLGMSQLQAQPGEKVMLDKIIVKIDDEIILKSEIEKNYLQARQNMGAKAPEDLYCRVLESMVINKMMLAKANLDSVIVDENMVENEFNRRWQVFIGQFGSEEKLLEFLEQQGQDPNYFKANLKNQIHEQLVIQRMEQQITSGIEVSPGEVKQFFKEIPEDSLPLFSKEVEMGQIVKKATLGAAQQNEVVQKLKDIKKQIQNGADFCEMAKKYSMGPSAPYCGDLDWANRGDFVPEFEAAVLKLKPGQISDPVKTQFGFHIIELIEVRGNQFHARHIIMKPGEAQLDTKPAIEFLDSLRNEIIIDSITFAAAAKKFSDHKPTANNGGMFAEEQSGSLRVPYDQLNFELTSIIDTMEEGSITVPIPFELEENGIDAVRIIYLKRIIPQHKADIHIDYNKIQQAALNEKKNNTLNEWFDKTKKEVYIHIDEDLKSCQLLITQ